MTGDESGRGSSSSNAGDTTPSPTRATYFGAAETRLLCAVALALFAPFVPPPGGYVPLILVVFEVSGHAAGAFLLWSLLLYIVYFSVIWALLVIVARMRRRHVGHS